MLAECISFFSGLHLLCLDRFDVLSVPNRKMALQWLTWMADDGDLETVLIFGTLKSCPGSNDTVTAYWVEGGVIAQPEVKKADAA